MTLQRQKEECYQAGPATRQRAAQEVSGPQFQRKTNSRFQKVNKNVSETGKNALMSIVYSNEMPIFAFEKSSKFQRSYDKRTLYR